MDVLTHSDIAKIAPAVYNKGKHERTSRRYAFIPTDRIINDLCEVDWYPVHVESVHSRKQSISHAKHMLRFRSRNDMSVKHEKTGDVIMPELVITNSHDGKNAFRAHIGIFRLACSNTLLISDEFGERQSMRVTHKGYDKKTVLKIINYTIDGFSQVFKNIEQYRETNMSMQEQIDMAEKAINLRWQYNYIRPDGIEPEMFLKRRRLQDVENNLWNTYNVIQENMSRGGIIAYNKKGRRIVTRPIKNVRENLRFNKAIWSLLDKTYKGKNDHNR